MNMPTSPSPSQPDRQARWEERIARKLRDEPTWRVMAGDVWVCPYCGQPGAKGTTAEAVAPQHILAHLTRKCPAWKRGEGTPLPLPELTKWARVHAVARRLTHEPACQVRDADARWYDPFSGRRTKVTWPPGHSLDRSTLTRILQLWPPEETTPPLPLDVLRTSVKLHSLESHRLFAQDGVWISPVTGEPVPSVRVDVAEPAWHRSAVEAAHEHLTTVAQTLGSAATPLPLSRLLRVVRERNLTLRVAQAVRGRLATDPTWWELEPNDAATGGLCWVCPRCHATVPDVPVEPAWLRPWIAPFPIARHLVHDCAGRPAPEEPAETDDTPEEEFEQVTISGVEEPPTREQMKGVTKTVLDQAKAVQMGMLPTLPQLPELAIAAVFRPCDAVSGDFYDVVRVDEDRLGIAIGDVSGHGIHAALVMAAAKKSLAIHGRGEASPREVLCRVNDDIAPDLLASIFVTIWYGVLHLRTGELRHARAGHNPLLIVPGDGGEVVESEPPGMVVGMAPAAVFNKVLGEETRQLLTGDRLFLFTDGLNEAMDPDNEMLGIDAVAQELLDTRDRPPSEALAAVEARLEAFCRGRELDDDVTLVAVDWLAATASPVEIVTEPVAEASPLPNAAEVADLFAAPSSEEGSGPLTPAFLSQSWLRDWGDLPDLPPEENPLPSHDGEVAALPEPLPGWFGEGAANEPLPLDLGEGTMD